MRSRLPNSVECADLVSDGILGLMEAIDRFDPDRGQSFQTYAVPRVRGAMVDALRALDWVPRSVRERVRAVETVQRTLQSRLGRVPEDTEVATELGIGVTELRELYSTLSVTSLGTMEDLELADELSSAATQAVEDEETRAALAGVVETLPERDQVIIALYYFEGFTLVEVGRVLGVSESRVSQLHSRLTLMLRARLAGAGAT
jgi:RNA polymerase sigma factor for flagellar operon FliA